MEEHYQEESGLSYWQPMLRCSFFLLVGLAVVSLPGCATEPLRPETDDRPLNFILILVDDLGWKDAGVYGTTFYETPNIDQLARNSMRFTQFYTAGCVCSPTRASIMTGKHPARLNITDWISGRQRGRLLPATYDDHLPLRRADSGRSLPGTRLSHRLHRKMAPGWRTLLSGSRGFWLHPGGCRRGLPGDLFLSLSKPPSLESGCT